MQMLTDWKKTVDRQLTSVHEELVSAQEDWESKVWAGESNLGGTAG